MKTTSTTRTKIFTALLAFVLTFSMGAAQNLRSEENWLQAWKGFAGSQTSSTWLLDEMANGATLFSTADALVLQSTTDWNSLAEMKAALEEGMLSGNGNQMMAAGESVALSPTTAINSWIGQLGGRQLYATVVAQLENDGNSLLVMRLSLTPLHEDAFARNQCALALLNQLGSDALRGPLATAAK